MARADLSLSEAVAELLKRRPAWVGLGLVVRVRLEVQVLAANGAETGAVGRMQDLVGQRQSDRIARPGRQLELVVDDVLAAELLRRTSVGGVVLARVHV